MAKRKLDINMSDSEDSDVDNDWDFTECSDSESYSEDSSNSDDEFENASDSVDYFDDIPWSDSGIPRPSFPFTSKAGIQIAGLNKDNLLGIFETFFTDELIDIVTETNRYAT
ncbi:hypothetical protein QE152_g27535 [Popillia japonica]|uniref:PiggyBac transposable element-derived protein domain-containing protein n=1 Tax=Popillia japonica TaxID=7064 RepID=A0AAW1JV46_POPJA